MDCDRRLRKRCHNSWNTSARFEQSLLNQVPVNFVKTVECLDFQITLAIITTKNCSLTGVYWCIRYSYGTIRGNAQLFSAHINRDVISCKYMTWHNIFNTKHSVSLAANYTKRLKRFPNKYGREEGVEKKKKRKKKPGCLHKNFQACQKLISHSQ